MQGFSLGIQLALGDPGGGGSGLGNLIVGNFDHSIPITGSHFPGVRSAGYTEKAWGTNRYVSTTAGANKVINICHRPLVFISTNGSAANAMHHDWSFEMVVNPLNAVAAYQGECLQGIQMGAFETLTPWQTNYANEIDTNGVIQFRYNFALSRFELLVWDGDTGLAPEVVPTTLNPTFSADLNAKRMRMDYAYNAGSPVIRCYLDGLLALQHSSTRLTNFSGSTPKYGFGYFATNGSNAAFNVLEAGFHENTYTMQSFE